MTTCNPLYIAEQIQNELRMLVDRHPFLEEFRSRALNVAELRRFASLWYLTSQARKEAFPYSSADALRSKIINIIYEHHCANDHASVDAQLLTRFLQSLDLTGATHDDALSSDPVRDFAERMRDLWSNSSPSAAFGVHFALEVATVLMHTAFAQGVIRSGIRVDASYFWSNQTAELQRADSLTDLFAHAADGTTSLHEVMAGVEAVQEHIVGLLNGLYALTFPEPSH